MSVGGLIHWGSLHRGDKGIKITTTKRIDAWKAAGDPGIGWTPTQYDVILHYLDGTHERMSFTSEFEFRSFLDEYDFFFCYPGGYYNALMDVNLILKRVEKENNMDYHDLERKLIGLDFCKDPEGKKLV